MAEHDKNTQSDGDADFLRRAWCYLESRLGADELPQFQTELMADPEKRRRFIRLCLTRAALIEELRKQSADATAPDSGSWQITGATTTQKPTSRREDNARMPRPTARQIRPATMRQKSANFSIWRIAAVLAIVATAVFALTSPLWMGWKKAAPLATLTDAVDAQWDMTQENMPQDGLAVGDSLPRGSLVLQAGYARITLDNGVNLVIKGPAHFNVESLMRVQLEVGKLTADVPHTAMGFTVKMPTATVTDLGTTFGVTAFANGEGSVQVIKGKVQAKLVAVDGTTKVQTELTEYHAAAFNPALGTLASIPVEPDSYVTDIHHLPPPPTPYARWLAYSNQLRNDPSLLAYYAFDNQAEAPKRLLNRAAISLGQCDGEIENAAWVDGRFPGKNKGLQFNGKDSRVKVNIPKQVEHLTVAMWVRMDSWKVSGLLMSDDWNQVTELDFAVDQNRSLDANVNTGSGGPFRLHGTLDKNLLGHWIHLVATFDTQSSTVATYCNGVRMGQDTISRMTYVCIGSAQIGNWDPKTWNYGHTFEDFHRGLNGRIDEVAIFNRTLSSSEIHAMYQEGLNEK